MSDFLEIIQQPTGSLSIIQFELGLEIGKGQFSVVHRAIFLPTGQAVAIKRLPLYEMVDSKARADCVKEIHLLKVLYAVTSVPLCLALKQIILHRE